MRSEGASLRKELQNWKEKYEQQRKAREKETEQYIKDKQSFSSKEKQFYHQIKEIQNLHAETKKTYTATFDTLKDNDRIFRSIENVAMSTSKLASCRKFNEEKQATAAKRYYEGQVEKIKGQYDDDIAALKNELNSIRKQYEEQKNKVFQRESELERCIEQK